MPTLSGSDSKASSTVAPHDRLRWAATVAASEVGMAAKTLAVVIAYHARDGRLMHAVETIAGHAQLSERACRPAIAELVEAGFLDLVSPGGGRGRPAVYAIKGANAAPFEKQNTSTERVQVTSLKGADSVAKGCKLRQERVQILHPHRSIQRSEQRRGAEKARALTTSHQEQQDQPASVEQLRTLAGLLRQYHGIALACVPEDAIVWALKNYHFQIVVRVTKDCKEHPPEGNDAVQQWSNACLAYEPFPDSLRSQFAQELIGAIRRRPMPAA